MHITWFSIDPVSKARSQPRSCADSSKLHTDKADMFMRLEMSAPIWFCPHSRINHIKSKINLKVYPHARLQYVTEFFDIFSVKQWFWRETVRFDIPKFIRNCPQYGFLFLSEEFQIFQDLCMVFFWQIHKWIHIWSLSQLVCMLRDRFIWRGSADPLNSQVQNNFAPTSDWLLWSRGHLAYGKRYTCDWVSHSSLWSHWCLYKQIKCII
jgi:hypothetical protein